MKLLCSESAKLEPALISFLFVSLFPGHKIKFPSIILNADMTFNKTMITDPQKHRFQPNPCPLFTYSVDVVHGCDVKVLIPSSANILVFIHVSNLQQSNQTLFFLYLILQVVRGA